MGQQARGAGKWRRAFEMQQLVVPLRATDNDTDVTLTTMCSPGCISLHRADDVGQMETGKWRKDAGGRDGAAGETVLKAGGGQHQGERASKLTQVRKRHTRGTIREERSASRAIRRESRPLSSQRKQAQIVQRTRDDLHGCSNDHMMTQATRERETEGRERKISSHFLRNSCCRKFNNILRKRHKGAGKMTKR